MTVAEALSAAMVIVMFGVVLWAVGCAVMVVYLWWAFRRSRRILRDTDTWARRSGGSR